MKKNILVVGGTGFIGYHLLKKLDKKQFNLLSISTKYPIKKKKIKKVKYLICDISNYKVLKKKLKGLNINYVINLGGYINHSNIKKTKKSHLDGCVNLINYFKYKKISNFIQVGSSLEYGPRSTPHSEKNLNCNPVGNYGLSKLKATEFLKKNGKNYKLPFTILRLYQIYGPYQTVDRLVPMVINKFLSDKNFPCTEGNQIRDFLYINDLIDLFLIIIGKKKAFNQIFNVGSGKKIKIRALIQKIQKKIKKGKPLFGKIKMRKDEVLSYTPNLNKIKKFYNWSSKVSLDNGLNKTIQHYEK